VTAPPSIRLDNAGKRYTKYEDQPMLLNSLRHLGARTRRHKLWALRHCGFDVRRGDCVGVLGRNGSGKSTLLQMIAGVTAPTEGLVEIHGRVAPLVQVGVGFHPELTGRENVYVNGTILGLGRAQIDERYSAIVEFSELGDFMDTPVKFYSSGMYVRLGFSVAIAATPDILVIDEVLAVGDLAFQNKCFQRMSEIGRSGTTMVVVSHNVHQIKRVCQRTIVLEGGQVTFDGPTDDAISAYFDLLGKTVTAEASGDIVVRDHGVATLVVDMLDAAGRPTRQFESGDTMHLHIDARLRGPIRSPEVGVVVSTTSGTEVYAELIPGLLADGEAGEQIRCELRIPMRLVTGSYQVMAALSEYGRPLGEVAALSERLLFHVSGRAKAVGVADLHATVDVISQGTPAAGDQTSLD
jgi:ABC-type polysaccharide/polyol phosphate transport system ATPase subunit